MLQSFVRNSTLCKWAPRERHPSYMGSLVDFRVSIPEPADDIKLLFICFTLLTHVILLLCVPQSLELMDLSGRKTDHGIC